MRIVTVNIFLSGTELQGLWRQGPVMCPTCADLTTAIRYLADTDSPSKFYHIMFGAGHDICCVGTSFWFSNNFLISVLFKKTSLQFMLL